MNITELRYLVAIRKWGSVSAAAKQLYAAQPNVSKALKNLEEEYGVRISTVLSIISDDGMRQVKIRFWSEDAEAENKALEKLKDHAGLRYWARGGEVYLRDKPDFKL